MPIEFSVPMSAPDLDESDIEAVVEVLRSARLALGSRAEQFERMLADYVGVENAIAVSSGTAALHLIVRALQIGSGDEVLLPSFTFIASLNALLYEGATPVFVDIEPRTLCLDPGDLERKITARTKAIMAVDAFGHPADWDAVTAIAARHRLAVIDDSCEALGAEYRGRKIGQFGAAAAFAFYPNKQMTTGEGGMVVTNNADLARRVRSLRNQGRDRHHAWLEHARLGFNYRMDEMSAALGVSQLRRMECFMARRARVARWYNERLATFDGVEVPHVQPQVRMSWFVYVIRVAPEIDRDAVMRGLAAQGIPSRAYFSPVHLQPFVREYVDCAPGDLPLTESIAARTLALPFHNRLTEHEVERVVAALKRSLRAAPRPLVSRRANA
ncbi:MAG: DegT/DnrJ/EryC1/StrS family aminotransferase [Gammaproteobacteria bacterium]